MTTTTSANTSILLSLDSIQNQIQHCENIKLNIDTLVPKLYKIRQQAQAQKEYLNDINQTLLDNNGQKNNSVPVRVGTEDSTAGTADPGTKNTLGGIVLNVSVPNNTDATPTVNKKFKNKNGLDITTSEISGTSSAPVNLYKIIQSLSKYKHDQGTSVHFTTEQTGNSDNRTKGLNLSDVESITSGLNDFLSINSITPDETKANNALKKLFAPIENADLATGVSNDEILSKDTVEEHDNTTTLFDSDLKAESQQSPPDEASRTRPISKNRLFKSKRQSFAASQPVAAEMKRVRGFSL